MLGDWILVLGRHQVTLIRPRSEVLPLKPAFQLFPSGICSQLYGTSTSRTRQQGFAKYMTQNLCISERLYELTTPVFVCFLLLLRVRTSGV